MKEIKISLLLIIFISTIFMPAFSADIDEYNPGLGWTLFWSDEFSEETINQENWTHDVGFGLKNDGWGVWGAQKYTTDIKNSYIDNGKLIMKAFYLGGPFDKRNYTSAKLTTQGKKSFKYGKIAARIKMPYGKGMFPAFWMLGTTWDGTNWAKCGEIDIAEMLGGGKGKDDINHGTIHYFDEYNNRNIFFGGEKKMKEKLSAQFHVYEVEWGENEIVWKIDGEKYHREVIAKRTHSERSEIHNEFFLILNLGVGAYFDLIGYPDKTTKFPQTMEIDWVRVYKMRNRKIRA